MNSKRYNHACFTDKASSSIYIAGGRVDHSYLYSYLSSTEKWTFDENAWTPSANLPEEISRSSAVSSNIDEFIGYMAGRYKSNKIYGLRRREMEWIKLNKTLKTGRWGHSLLNIPANQILGC